jgi:hypothetical protein
MLLHVLLQCIKYLARETAVILGCMVSDQKRFREISDEKCHSHIRSVQAVIEFTEFPFTLLSPS